MLKIPLYQGEAKNLAFRIKDGSAKRWLDLTGTSCMFIVKRSPEDEDPVIQKNDEDFNKVGAASGYLSIFMSTDDTWQEPWVYDAEIRIIGTGSIEMGAPETVSKIRFDLEILEAIY